MTIRKTTKVKNKELAEVGKQLNHFGITLRIYPDEEQVDLINRTFGCSRLIYNKYLADRNQHYKDTGKILSVNKYKFNYLTPMKKIEDFIFLKDVDKFALEVAIENVDDAFTRFFNKQNGFPKFKSKHNSRKAYTTKITNNNIEIVNDFIKLPKLKLVKFNKPSKKNISENLENTIGGNAVIKKATIYEKAGKYYVSILCEEIINIIEPLKLNNIDNNKIIGVDLGLTDFATITNGMVSQKVDNPKHFKRSEEKLAKAQRSLSKKKKGSKNFGKAKLKVTRIHQDITNQRKDFAHQLSRKLVNENQVIVVENLNIKGMVKNKKLAKSISDAGWSRFIVFLEYKLEREGKHLVKVDRWFASSKICSHCTEKNIMLTLNQREWACSNCGAHLDRDINASINIREEGIKLLGMAA